MVLVIVEEEVVLVGMEGMGVEGVAAFLMEVAVNISGSDTSPLCWVSTTTVTAAAEALQYSRDMIPIIVSEYFITYLCYTYIFFYAKNITF